MKSILASMSALVAAIALAQAAEYHLVAGKTAWRSPDSYQENAVPPAGADIVVPENGVIALSDADDWDFVNVMASVRPLKGSVFAVDVPSGTRELACSVYVTADNSAWAVGTFRKTGAGTLTLTRAQVSGNWGERADYNVDMDVQGGTLALYPQTDMGNKIVMLREVNVGAGAVFASPGNARLNLWQLNGDGVVTNANDAMKPTTLGFMTSGAGGSFGGRIVGNFGLRVEGRQSFTGTSSPFGGNSLVRICNYTGERFGICGLGAMAGSKRNPGLPTSVGLDYLNLGSPDGGGSAAYLKYLGTGETVAKVLYFAGWRADVPFVLDAGETGGWTFAGSEIVNVQDAHLHVVLTGSNATESVMSTGNLNWNAKGYVEQVTKRGPGIWKLKESGEKSALGLVAVEEGTLRYDTLRDRGRHCALGTAETLFDGLVGPTDESRRVPYAVRIGGTDAADSVFEHVGTSAVCTATRPIGLGAGVAHIRSSGTRPLRLRGVGGVTADAHELVLDGANADENILSTVTNGQGVVSVTKDGSGTWTLAGEQSWSGALSVRGGTLNLLSPAAYSFFKLVLKETLWNCPRYADYIAEKGVQNGSRHQVALGEFALYSADGRRQNTGLVDGASLAELAPGEASFGYDARPAADASHPWYNKLFPLFNGRGFVIYDKPDGTSDTSSTEFYCNNPGNRDFSLSDPSGWMPIVVRLTNATPAIAFYDLGYSYGTDTGAWGSSRAVTAYEILGSVDGLVWDDAPAAKDDAVDVRASAGWLSDGKTFYHDTASHGHRDVTGAGDCFPLRGAPEKPAPFLSNVTGFSISGGATVRAIGARVALPSGVRVTIDASAASVATVEGLEFPASGTIDVVGYACSQGKAVLPVSFAGGETYANMENWTVCVDGVESPDVRVRASNGTLKVIPPGGALLIVR